MTNLSPKPWTQTFHLHCAQRINNTSSGNPQWLLHLGLTDQVTTVLRTAPDAQFAHEDLSAYEHQSILVTIASGVITALHERT